MTYYKTKYNEFGKTWAVLNEDNEPVFCDWRQARKWRKTVGTQRCQIKFNRVGPQKIETRFIGESSALDGPHLFWQVRLSVIHGLEGNPPFQGIRNFATLEEALTFHEAKRKQFSQWLKSSHIMPDRAQELLAQLSHWCDQKWDRQAYC
jgi:hypothetical protein